MAAMRLSFDVDEAERLHNIAYAAAIQTGAKGAALDKVTSDIFVALAAQTNQAMAEAESGLRLVK